MKQAAAMLVIATALLATSACKPCKNDDPRARILNNGTDKASVQVKTTGGNTININNIQPGTASSYDSFAAGDATFTITVSNVDYVEVVPMANCYEYDIAIDANNVITTTAINRND